MSDFRARLDASIAGQYVIERELGGGGMSRTYVATERSLNRRVVIKVLAPELLAGVSVERFNREILMAAQLQHPHIVPVLGAGDADGLPWFTMPYVDGESVRVRLGKGPLSIGEVISILRDVARALAFAHSHGVVHRDIKPDNVLLSAGSATVTDFGIAKAISASRTVAGGSSLTVAGTSIGTPAYIAPEQAAGDPNTDHRADFYSFGVMAYELLSGRPPFHDMPPAKMLAAHMSERPRDIRELRPDVPAPLAQVVMRCLEKSPDDRPQHGIDIVKVLDSVTSSGAGAAAPAILAGGQIRLGRAVGVWMAATLLIALTAWAATAVIGLPEWVLPGSLGVMLLGLPMIFLTAYVQRTTYRMYTATPAFTPGGNTAAHSTMATLALKASPHVSWRRTWWGGGIAVGAFAALVLAFMVMRALGIGPVGSLMGKGAFGAKETIVVADFKSPAGDPTLGVTASEALRTDLAQSTSLKVLTKAVVSEILRLMQKPVDATVPFALAHEVAAREGAAAVVIAAGKATQDVARQRLPVGARTIAGFHRMLDQRADLDDVAALRRRWNVDQRAGHGRALFDAGSQRHDDVDAVRPEGAAAHLRDGDQFLRRGQPDAGRDTRLAGARSERECADVALGIRLVEDGDHAHVIRRRHRALDVHGDRHAVAVVDDRRDLELDAAGIDARTTGERRDDRRQFFGSAERRTDQQPAAGERARAEQPAAGAQQRRRSMRPGRRRCCGDGLSGPGHGSFTARRTRHDAIFLGFISAASVRFDIVQARSLLTQTLQVSHHILDLLCRQQWP